MARAKVADPVGCTVEAPSSKTQIAYGWIRDRIFNGQYGAGYRLVLSDLARQLQVSVVPVREAIRLLEAEGLVHFAHNQGAQVAMLAPEEYIHTMETLSVVEGAATALAAPHITAAELDHAEALNGRMKLCLEHFDPRRMTELNLEFHQLLFDRCPNPHLLELVYRGWNRLRVLRDSIFSFVPGRARASIAEHQALLGLLRRGAEPLEIELATRRHRAATLQAFLAVQREHVQARAIQPERRDA